MNKKILIIGNLSSIYIYNYVKEIIKNNNYKIYICDTDLNKSNKTGEFYCFYLKTDIEIIDSNFEEGISDNQVSTSIMKLRLLGIFDICHVHYLGWTECIIASAIRNQISKLILSYWGSELLCSDNKLRDLQEVLLQKAQYITMNSLNLMECFKEKFSMRYLNKISKRTFGSPIMNEIQLNMDKESIKRNFKVPADKIIVTCGYNATREQQHNLIIKSLNKCSSQIKEKIFLIFPMTYGKEDEYLLRIEENLKNTGLEYKIFSEYMSTQEVAELRVITDIFINMQITDAKASSVLESLYAKAIMINGAWLKYYELEEKKVYYENVNNIEDISETISSIVKHIHDFKEKCINNSLIIKRLNDMECKIEQWINLYEGMYKKSFFNYDLGIEEYEKNLEKTRKKDKINYNILELWIQNKIQGKELAEWFRKHKKYNILIYGIGNIGKLLVEELILSKDLNIFLCDQYTENRKYKGIDIMNMDKIKNLDIDQIVITPVNIYKEICKEIQMIIGEEKITSFYDILKQL